jgi:type II secretory pathway component GspD/PulD (secretin)
MWSRSNWVAVLSTSLLVLSVSSRLWAAEVDEDPFGGSSPKSLENEPKKPPRPTAGEDAIRRALATPASMEFVEQPLSDVVSFLKDQHEIEIQLDLKALEDAGVATDTPITRKLKGITLRSALRLMLVAHNLTYVIKDEVLLITTQAAAEEMFETRLYEVSDLVADSDLKHSASSDRLKSLIQTVRETVQPGSWPKTGDIGPCALRPYADSEVNAIVIRQTFDGHEQVSELLNDLRKLKRQKLARGDR